MARAKDYLAMARRLLAGIPKIHVRYTDEWGDERAEDVFPWEVEFRGFRGVDMHDGTLICKFEPYMRIRGTGFVDIGNIIAFDVQRLATREAKPGPARKTSAKFLDLIDSWNTIKDFAVAETAGLDADLKTEIYAPTRDLAAIYREILALEQENEQSKVGKGASPPILP